MPGDSIAAHRGRTLSPRWLRAAPTQHIAPAQTRSTAEHRVSPTPDPRTDDLAQPIIPLSPSLALSLSSACQGIRDSHNHRSALVDASRALCLPTIPPYMHLQIFVRRGNARKGKRRALGVRSLSPSTTPEAGPRPREMKGVGIILLPAPIAPDPLCASPAVQYNPPPLSRGGSSETFTHK
jgi:hypothetical protein